MGRGLLRAAGVAVALVGLGAAGCSDDGPAPPISQADYEQHVAAACAQHGAALAEAGQVFTDNARSTSDRVAYFRSEWIPRVRSIIHSLADGGFPEGHDAEYRAALSQVLTDLDDFEARTVQSINEYQDGTIDPSLDFPKKVHQNLVIAGINCVN
jgi:hypothetical protein